MRLPHRKATWALVIWTAGVAVWLMSRPHERICPTCGRAVKAGLTVCPSCSHDFACTDTTAPAQRGVPDAEA